MSARAILPSGIETGGVPPLERIARAEVARGARAREVPEAEARPDLVPAADLHRPQGLAADLDAALGPVELPTLFELQAALSSAAALFAAEARADGPLGPLDTVVAAVLAEEQDKILRYIGVRDA